MAVNGGKAAAAKLAVPALWRATAVLDLLAETGQPMSLSDMSRRLGFAKSTLHGLCDTLSRLDLLQVSAAGFEVGAHTLRWSAAYLARNDLVRAFERLAQDPRLAEQTLTLSVLEQGDVVYLGCRNSNRPLGFTFQIGMRLPAVFSATGKAMLSCLPDDERLAHLAGDWPQPYTPASTPDATSFEAQLSECRARGYAVDAGEIREGMICVGVPVRDSSGRVAAGLAISMTDAEAKAAGTDHFAAGIRELADQLTWHL